MRREIAEQPAPMAGRPDHAAAASCGTVRARIWTRPPRAVLFVARGTSDHAALYANYLVQTALGVPAASASPSVVTLYGGDPICGTCWSSRSASPAVTGSGLVRRDGPRPRRRDAHADQRHRARRSPRSATRSIDIRAGRETAVAATKSYTGELLALAALFADEETVRAAARRCRSWASRCWRPRPIGSRNWPPGTGTPTGS